jgi:hypothetical protein
MPVRRSIGARVWRPAVVRCNKISLETGLGALRSARSNQLDRLGGGIFGRARRAAMLARAKKTPVRHMAPDERKAHNERLRADRDNRRAESKARRYADAGLPPPPPAKIGAPCRSRWPVPRMPPDSKPSWAAEGVGERRLWCRRYDRCLSYAAAADAAKDKSQWPGFDCTACGVREEEPPTTRILEGMGLDGQDEIREVWAAIRRRN